jgi:hypothetical protein
MLCSTTSFLVSRVSGNLGCGYDTTRLYNERQDPSEKLERGRLCYNIKPDQEEKSRDTSCKWWDMHVCH